LSLEYLDLLIDLVWFDHDKVNIVMEDANEILAIFTSIGKKPKL
jgi:hypothetical protein